MTSVYNTCNITSKKTNVISDIQHRKLLVYKNDRVGVNPCSYKQ